MSKLKQNNNFSKKYKIPNKNLQKATKEVKILKGTFHKNIKSLIKDLKL